MTRRELEAIDLCCGAGGWACAARGLPIRVKVAVDFCDACCRTYAMNHPLTHVICGDVRHPRIRRQILQVCGGTVDLVLGAIPCAWLSTRRTTGPASRVSPAERKRERRTLLAVLGLVDKLAPTYWCLEDVPGLADELPPGVASVTIDSEYFSAQRRRRLYAGSFPVPTLCVNDQRLSDKLRPGPYRIGRRAAERRADRARTFAADSAYGARPTDKGPTVCAFSSRRDAELVILDEAIAGGRRQIEWQEAAQLQGFPADYVFYGSPTDVWKMVGDAIQIDTGRAILDAIIRRRNPDSTRPAAARSAVEGVNHGEETDG